MTQAETLEAWCKLYVDELEIDPSTPLMFSGQLVSDLVEMTRDRDGFPTYKFKNGGQVITSEESSIIVFEDGSIFESICSRGNFWFQVLNKLPDDSFEDEN